MRTLLSWSLFLLLSFLGSCDLFLGNNTDKNEAKDEHPELTDVTNKISKDPKNPMLYVARSRMYHQLKQDSLAIIDLKKAIQLDSSKSEYHSALGQILFDHKDVSGSVPYFQKAIELNPNDEVSHLKMAKVFLFTAEYPKAFIEINTVLRANVYNPEAYFLKGMCYKNMKDTAKAISSFQTAVQTDPKFSDGYMQLALIHEARKSPLALQYFENAFKADPENMEALYGQGMYWQKQEKYEEAKKVYRRMIGLNPGFAKSYYNTGWILLQQDSADRALRQFDLAIKNQPDYGDAWFNKGICLELLEKPKEAQSAYEQAGVFLNHPPKVNEALQRVKQ